MYGLYFVYIIEGRRTSRNRFGDRVFYTGMTGNIRKRTVEHFHKIKSGYMIRNRIDPVKLVYLETADSYHAAMTREMEIKRFSLAKKVNLIVNLQRKLGGQLDMREETIGDIQKYFWGKML